MFLLIHLKRGISLFYLYRFRSFSFGFVSIFSILKVKNKSLFCNMGYMFWSLEDIKDIAISRMEQRWKSIPTGSEKPPNSNQFTLTRIYWTSKCCGAIYHKTGLAKRGNTLPWKTWYAVGKQTETDSSFYLNAMGCQWAINLIIQKPEDFWWSFN